MKVATRYQRASRRLTSTGRHIVSRVRQSIGKMNTVLELSIWEFHLELNFSFFFLVFFFFNFFFLVRVFHKTPAIWSGVLAFWSGVEY